MVIFHKTIHKTNLILRSLVNSLGLDEKKKKNDVYQLK